MKHTETQCAGHKCARPVTDTTICDDCETELVKALGWLLPTVTRGDREPTLDAEGRIVRNSFGRTTSTPWDTPSGEARNLPRMLAEQSAKLAVRKGLAIGHTPHAEPPLPVDLRAVDTAGRIRSVIATYATLASGHAAPLDGYWDVATVAAWLLDQIPHVRLQAWAGDMHRDVTKAVARAKRHVDAAPERKYLGLCGHTPERPADAPQDAPDPVPCPGQVFAPDGATVARCGTCRTIHDVQDRLDVIVERVRYTWLTTTELERALSSAGIRVTKNTMDTWIRRGRLVSDGGRPARYLVDDVLILAEQRRHSKAG